MSYIDVTNIDTLEIVIDRTGTKVWIHDNGQCVARWYRIKNLVVQDDRELGDIHGDGSA